ncbi:MAG: 50S ribosomal protein L21 [Thiomargarita sp.]|nr:50S ribosomal protein L21 [Thiomargarita sp.]
MYAVIQTGGKQYKVAPGATLRIEKILTAPGETVDFNTVLMVVDGDNLKIGTPQVEGGKVSAVVVAHGRDKKVKIIKFKRRKHYRRQMGHRQHYTEVTINTITADGIEAATPVTEVTE